MKSLYRKKCSGQFEQENDKVSCSGGAFFTVTIFVMTLLKIYDTISKLQSINVYEEVK